MSHRKESTLQSLTDAGPVRSAHAVSAVQLLLAKKKREDQIGLNTPFDELGLDSLDVAELFVILEDVVGCELDPDSAPQIVNVGDLTRLAAA